MDSVKASVKQIVLKDDFIGRQKQLYEQLAHIEKSLNKHHNHKDSHVPRLEDLSRSGSNRKRIKGLRGRQSIFKRPEGPAPRSKIQAVPDYHRNPTKWTYYSLDDVTEMTNESNSAAAFAFLDELKQRKHRESRKQNKIKEKLKVHTEAMEIDSNEATIEDQMDMEENSEADDGPKTVILFCKPQAKKEPPKEDSKPEFRNGKIVMPEYEVGTKKVLKKKKSEKKKLDKIDKKEKLKLDHLEDYEDDEE